MPIVRDEESKRIQAASDAEWENLELERIGVTEHEKYKEIFIIDIDPFSFFQYLSKGKKYYMNIDGEKILGPFQDHVECLKMVCKIVMEKEREHSEKYRQIHNLVDKW